MAVEAALTLELRGLRSGSTLARFLARHRGKRHRRSLPRLSVGDILEWADDHFARHGSWPTRKMGRIKQSPGETWNAIDIALMRGRRGLPNRSSLAKLLAERRGVRNRGDLPRLTKRRITAWAVAHRKRTALWPNARSGPVLSAPGETWLAIQQALRGGYRGLPGGSSLAKLLGRRNKRIPKAGPSLAQILAWADAHFKRTGTWPTKSLRSRVAEAPGETWLAIDSMLRSEGRGWRGRTSLSRLLRKYRGVLRPTPRPRWTQNDILAWADAHRDQTGEWPTTRSGSIGADRGQTWRSVDCALVEGYFGLKGGSSLAQLLAVRRGKRNPGQLSPLRIREILAWVDDHHRRHGHWPTCRSGLIDAAPGETWSAVNACLRNGYRGLPGGSSLAALLARHGKRNLHRRPRAR